MTNSAGETLCVCCLTATKIKEVVRGEKLAKCVTCKKIYGTCETCKEFTTCYPEYNNT